jgi:hypothetical protein
MPTTLHQIDARSKFNDMFFALPGDFTRSGGVEVDARRVIDEPGWSPYCLDPENNTLTFVRIPAETDLAKAAFYFLTQYREANAVIDMPFDEAMALAETLPSPEIALIFSIGRCGTTLASHALNGSPEVVSLSEPEVFAHRAFRALPASADRRRLVGALCRLLFAARSNRDARLLAIKFRSQALFIGEDIYRALPRAKYVFMYRDAVTWSESFVQFVLAVGATVPFKQEMLGFAWGMISADQPISVLANYADIDGELTEPAALTGAAWSVHLAEYHRLLHLGAPFLALRYNELVANRKTELERLFTHCGIATDAVDRALDAFDEDSQKGTIIERKDGPARFDPAAIELLRKTLSVDPLSADPDARLPDIYTR